MVVMIVSVRWMHARTLETSGTTARTRRSPRNPSLAWARLTWWSAVCASVALCACSSDSGSEPTPPIEPEAGVPRGLEKVTGLRNAAMAIEDRPARCTTTRAIVIVDGKPTPRKLRARSGVCLYWGNKSSGRVRVEQLRAPGVRLQAPTDWFVMPAGTVHGLGPYETLTPRELRQVSLSQLYLTLKEYLE